MFIDLYLDLVNTLQRKSHLCIPFRELRGLTPNFHIHVSVSDLYIPRIGPHISLQQKEANPMSGVLRTIDPPPPLPLASVSSPRAKGGGVHTRRAVSWWGVNISENARHWIGLSQYNPSTGIRH